MNTMDIGELAADCDRIIGGLPDYTTRGPIYVTRDGVHEATIIRAQAWAPRLHDFGVDPGGIRCYHCQPNHRILCDGSSLGVALEAANKHWRETHREKR